MMGNPSNTVVNRKEHNQIIKNRMLVIGTNLLQMADKLLKDPETRMLQIIPKRLKVD